MALYYNTNGFIFKKEDRHDADGVFSVFTRDFGRVEIFGKAIRKIDSKLKSAMEIFSFSEIEFVQGKNRKTLTDAFLEKKFNFLTDSPEKLEIAHRISDSLSHFIKGQEKDKEIFSLIEETFEKLNDQPKHFVCWQYFFWNLLATLGYKPRLSACAICNNKLKEDGLYFSCKEGGILCQNCQTAQKNGIKVSAGIVKVLRLILNREWDILPKLKFEPVLSLELESLSKEYAEYLSYTDK